MTESFDVLKIPPVADVEFKKNFIRQVVCELRFPTILEWENAPPPKFQALIRREYPHYQRSKNISLQPGSGPMPQEAFYKFQSKDRKWAITLKASSISLETAAYTVYEELATRLRSMLDAAEQVIDTDFYTRVGLRYVNALPVEQKDLQGWLNADLAPALVNGTFGEVEHHWAEVRGRTPTGGYSFRHGFAAVGNTREYILDFDFYQDLVDCNVARKVASILHNDAFRMFMWCTGPAAKSQLGKPTPKAKAK